MLALSLGSTSANTMSIPRLFAMRSAVPLLSPVNWQKTSGYNRRSKVEASISRYKRVIGDTLKSREDARRVTEIAIAIKSLNRMRKLGQANFVRVA